MSQNKGRNARQKQELKRELSRKHGNICQICMKPFPYNALTLDHIIPLAMNGSWHISNLQLACYPCNQEKGDTYIDPWSLI